MKSKFSFQAPNLYSVFVICFVLCILVATSHSLKDHNDTLIDPKIVIMGPTGAGKSSLSNVFIGASPDCTDCVFPICPGTESCTKTTSFAVDKWLGKGDFFTVVDTPGFGDSDNDDNKLIDEMMNILKGDINTTNTFLLAFNGENDRLDDKIQQMIREMEALFGYGFWNHTVLGVTHWAYDEHSIQKRERTGKTEEWWTSQMNTALQERYHLYQNLSAVFIDSWAQMDFNLDDPSQQEAYIRETSKLWNYTTAFAPFEFRTLEDVLADYNKCMKTLEDDIVEIKKNITELQMVDTDIQNEVDIVENQMVHVETRLSQIKEMPIGSIVSWTLKPEAGANHTEMLPEGWIRCDGGIIPEPSVWAGSHAPNLNGQKLFLRGGSDARSLTVENDMYQDHTHIDSGHTHGDNGHTHTYTDKYPNYYNDGRCPNQNGHIGPNGMDTSQDRFDCGTNRGTSRSNVGIKSAKSGVKGAQTGRHGTETRPKNMAVVYILRIF